MVNPKKKAKHVNFAVRADDSVIARIEKIAEWIAAKNPWLSKYKSHALRSILFKGVEGLEAEMAREPAPTPEKPKTSKTARKGRAR